MDLVLKTWFTSVTFTYMSNLPEVKIMDEREKQRSWLQNLASTAQFSSQVLSLKWPKVSPHPNSDGSISHPPPSASMLPAAAVGHQDRANWVLTMISPSRPAAARGSWLVNVRELEEAQALPTNRSCTAKGHAYTPVPSQISYPQRIFSFHKDGSSGIRVRICLVVNLIGFCIVWLLLSTAFYFIAHIKIA